MIIRFEAPENFKNFVVGLSGGADSLCLTLLVHEFCSARNLPMSACIIDHALRPESATEIVPILDILKNRAIPCDVLKWQHGPDLGGNIEQKARAARYDLLYKYCVARHADCLCVAHHALDQWETFFMRLSRGSGLRGLSAMQPITPYKDIKILRPLLNFAPSDIKETLENFGVRDYVRDPMNNDEKYERVRWRKAYAAIEKHGLTMQSVEASIRRMQHANDCLDEIAQAEFCQLFDGGRINCDRFRKLHIELRIRVLSLIVRHFSPEKQVISYSLLERMAQKILSEKFSATTFCGLVFKRSRGIIVFLENRLKFKKNDMKI